MCNTQQETNIDSWGRLFVDYHVLKVEVEKVVQ